MSKYRTVYNVLFFFVTVYGHDMRSFDDTILFKVNWPGKSNADLLESRPNLETYFITTANNEKYQCLIPDAIDSEDDHNEPYYGANPIEILSLLPKHSPCSYKVELYWTYELCHGKYVRQYHEDRDGKKVKIQEYYLGTFDKLQEMKLVAEYQERNLRPNRKAEIPVTKVDGINMPYVEIEMGDGTVCDINNKPRKVKVRYVCYQHGRHDLFSVKELVSCEYEVIVLSPVLCHHPDYKQQGTGGNEVNCLPVDNAPKKPRALISMEMESLKLQHQKVTDGEARVRVEIHPVDMIDKHNIEDSINSITDSGISPAEASPVKNFLSGKNCLHGGNGWWKYEFCYGRSVIQYHVERDGTKTTVTLGKFDKQKHLDWIAAHPHKKPKSPELRKQLSHFYSDGTICDKTGNPRQTEVKLKCVEGHTASPSSVSLFLLEPETCEYLLGVESPLICEILEYADGNGLLSEKFEDGEARVRVEINPVDMIDRHNMEESIDSISDPGISPVEASPAKNFFSGKNCLHGGHGWWKYEFCYGRSVIQYHVERDGTKTTVTLGKFDKQKHLEWIAAHPHKKPKSPELRKQLSHFYSDGTICDQTGNPRQTEVKLKCVEGHAASLSSVSLFLLEPETCEYLLGVESPLICDILKYADSNGLLSEKFEVNFDKLKTTAYHEYDDLDERIANGDD